MTEVRAGLPIVGFADADAFEAWIEAQSDDAPGLWLKLAKKGSRIASLSKAEAIDAALCHGWIDGQLDTYDEACWLIRFTPRKPRSKWSEVNRTRALQLIEAGRMRPTGLAQIEVAKSAGLWEVAYAPSSRAEVPPDLQAAANALGRVIASLQLRGISADQMPLRTPYQLDDCAWVANRWCELLPLPPDLKQRLMELDNPLVRLELVNDLLERQGLLRNI